MTIDVETYRQIRCLYLVERESQRAIAKKLGISRATVARYCKGERLPGEKFFSGRPPTRLQELVEPLILQYLAQNEEQLEKKQRLTATAIWRLLRERHGIDIGQSYARELVARLKKETQQAYIPLSFEPGEAMQVDWGDAKAVIGGVDTEVSLFCAVLPFSYAIFAAPFPNKKNEAFFTGHVLALEFFGGVPRRCIYDNLKSAVAHGAGPTAKTQASFDLLAAHYAFAAEFCNPAAGWEKGGVENLVKTVRRNIFSPKPDVESFEQLHELIVGRCLAYREQHKIKGRSLSVKEAFGEEQKHLAPLPVSPFEAAQVVRAKARHNCMVHFDRSSYSLPSQLAGQDVTVRATPYAVLIYHQGRLVAEHERTYFPNDPRYNPEHFVDLLERRPRSHGNAAPLKHGSWPKEFVEFRRLYRGDNLNQELVKLMRMAQMADRDALLRALHKANQSKSPTYELTLFQLQQMRALPEKPAADPIDIDQVNLEVYDGLFDEGGGDDER